MLFLTQWGTFVPSVHNFWKLWSPLWNIGPERNTLPLWDGPWEWQWSSSYLWDERDLYCGGLSGWWKWPYCRRIPASAGRWYSSYHNKKRIFQLISQAIKARKGGVMPPFVFSHRTHTDILAERHARVKGVIALRRKVFCLTYINGHYLCDEENQWSAKQTDVFLWYWTQILVTEPVINWPSRPVICLCQSVCVCG